MILLTKNKAVFFINHGKLKFVPQLSISIIDIYIQRQRKVDN